MRSVKTLGELADDITVGYVGSMASEYIEAGVPFLRSLNVRPYRYDSNEIKYISKSFHKKIGKSALKPGDVVAVRTGNPGVSCVIPEELMVANCSDLVVIRCGEKLDPFFVSCYLNFVANSYIKNQLVGAIQKHFNIGSAKGLPFPDLDKEHQIKLSTVIRVINQKIAINNKINTELEAMAKLIYDYWFVQFDFPDVNGKPYKSSGGKMVYNEILKREIPKGWSVTQFGKYNAVKKGELITKKTIETGKIKVVAAGLNYSYFHSTPNYPKNTITISGSGASAGFVNFWREPIFASDCITVRGPSDADTLLALHYLKLIQEYIFKQARGSAQPHVYPNDIYQLKYLIPPKKLVEAYGEIVLGANDKIAVIQKENEQLNELRDWLLPMLMNGQVSVKDV